MSQSTASIKTFRLKIIASILLPVLFSIGVFLSLHKPLWNDELYTHNWGIEKTSYTQILLGRMKEGNNAPLFYLTQKVFTDLIRFRLPIEWAGEWEMSLPQAQMILRLVPNLFLSLSLTLLFYFFARTYAIWTGIYALLLSLASPMVWLYWAEARPYSLWFFLTTVQMILFLKIIPEEKEDRILWICLSLSQILLCLTVSFGMVQAAIVSFLVWLRKKRNMRLHLWLSVLPMWLGFFYFLVGPKFKFRLYDPWPLIFSNIPPGRLVFLLTCLSGGIYLFLHGRNFLKISGLIKPESKMVILFLLIVFVVTAAVIGLFKFISSSELVGFEIPARYFIYLTPIGIIATTFFLQELIDFSRDKPWGRINITIVGVGMLLVQLLCTVSQVLALGIFY